MFREKNQIFFGHHTTIREILCFSRRFFKEQNAAGGGCAPCSSLLRLAALCHKFHSIRVIPELVFPASTGAEAHLTASLTRA
jgi:hypothetical protein